MTEPTTAAGRALLRLLAPPFDSMDGNAWAVYNDNEASILAIEAEARAPLEARIVDLNAEVLDRMDQWHRDSLARDELARQQNAEIARVRMECAALALGAALDRDALDVERARTPAEPAGTETLDIA